MLHWLNFIVKFIVHPYRTVIESSDVDLPVPVRLPHADLFSVVIIGEIIPLISDSNQLLVDCIRGQIGTPNKEFLFPSAQPQEPLHNADGGLYLQQEY